MKFTQKHAHAIVKKLGGETTKGKKHDQAVIYNDEHVIARYGIPRASKEVGHPYLPEQLGISPHQTSRLASCTLDRESYFELRSEQERNEEQ